MQHALLCISLPSLHDYDVKLPNFTSMEDIREHKTTIFFLWTSIFEPLRLQLLKTIANIWQIKRVGIRAMNKFEAARIHFLGGVLAAVAEAP